MVTCGGHLTGKCQISLLPGLSRPRRRCFQTAVGRSNPAHTYRNELSSVRPLCAVVDDRRQSLEGTEDVDSKIPRSPYNGKTAVVVGAGPSGSLAGMLLAKRGFNVKIFEKRGNPNNIPESSHRSIPNVLNPEVTRYLIELGGKIATDESEEGLPKLQELYMTDPSNGRMIRVPFPKDFPQRILMERHAIASSILKMGMALGLPNLEYNFDMDYQGVDLSSKTAKFLTPEGETEEVGYDLLVGADGINSKIRDSLQASGHLNFTQRTTPRTNISVRSLPLPKDASSRKFLIDNLGFGKLAFGNFTKVEGAKMRLVAFNTGNGFHVIFAGVGDNWHERIKGKALETVRQVAPPWCPEEWHEPIAERIMNGRTSTIGPATYCSSFIGPDVALLGDACHSATPALGIGSNRAVLDARDLDEALGIAGGNVPQALEAYERKCRPQIEAIQQLELFTPESALQGPLPWLAVFFAPHNKFHALSRKLFPESMPTNPYSLMAGSFITPREALRRYQLFAVAITVAPLTTLGGCIFLLSKLF
ncbi:hypothetical protein BSKO_04144 [Bryopsis sp. KO-2023]|nr:hypothetical protein BSKO_04144 [Bryopsis sp. KO-2023]